MTIKEMKKLHRELWTWVAENPGSVKDEWPRWVENGGDIPCVHAHCFACAIAILEQKKQDYFIRMCETCPISWGGTVCTDEDSEYGMWTSTESNSEEEKELALKISRMM